MAAASPSRGSGWVAGPVGAQRLPTRWVLASGLTTERLGVPDRHALAALGVRLLTVRECLAGTFQRPPRWGEDGRVVGAVEARRHYTSGSGVERTPDVCPLG